MYSTYALLLLSFPSQLTKKKLRCTQDGHFWIAAMHDWKIVEREQTVSSASASASSAAPQQQASPTIQQKRGGPEVLGSLRLQITLLPGTLPPQLDKQPGARAHVINERGLHEAAFAPKHFTARLERGNFIEPAYASQEGSSAASGRDRSRYAVRLVFDRSPYPPREQWASPDRGPDEGRFWEIVEFVGRKEERLKEAGRAMNDGGGGGWMGACVVS